MKVSDYLDPINTPEPQTILDTLAGIAGRQTLAASLAGVGLKYIKALMELQPEAHFEDDPTEIYRLLFHDYTQVRETMTATQKDIGQLYDVSLLVQEWGAEAFDVNICQWAADKIVFLHRESEAFASDAEKAAEERDQLRAAMKEILETLTVPAAEHVPAIRDAFAIILRTMGENWWEQQAEEQTAKQNERIQEEKDLQQMSMALADLLALVEASGAVPDLPQIVNARAALKRGR